MSRNTAKSNNSKMMKNTFSNLSNFSTNCQTTIRSNNQSPKFLSSFKNNNTKIIFPEASQLFSMNDVEDKFYSKGPTLSRQYIRPTTQGYLQNNFKSQPDFTKFHRLTKDAIDNISYNLNRKVYDKDYVELTPEKVKELKISKNAEKRDNPNITKDITEVCNENNGNKEDNNEMVSENVNYNVSVAKTEENKENAIKLEKLIKPVTIINRDKLTTASDGRYSKITPKDFENFQKADFVNTRLDKKENMNHNRENKSKNLESDIFFQRDNIEGQIRFIAQKNVKKDYLDSDIFCKKNNAVSLSKNGETFLFKTIKKDFTGTSLSESGWGPKETLPSLFNHTSIKFHILNPGIRNITKTKEEIVKTTEAEKAAHKSKGLGEYSDLTRVSAPNPNKNFNEIYKANSNSFTRSSNVCQNYFNLHGLYKEICDKPYYRKII